MAAKANLRGFTLNIRFPPRMLSMDLYHGAMLPGFRREIARTSSCNRLGPLCASVQQLPVRKTSRGSATITAALASPAQEASHEIFADRSRPTVVHHHGPCTGR